VPDDVGVLTFPRQHSTEDIHGIESDGTHQQRNKARHHAAQEEQQRERKAPEGW
jgi:hypothetical protein